MYCFWFRIIAVNYPARAKGVTRHMRGDEARKICPEIELVRVPNVRGKADLTKYLKIYDALFEIICLWLCRYREAGKEVAEVLKKFSSLLERASVDEAYLDITESVERRIFHLTRKITCENLQNTFIVGSNVKDFLDNIYEDEHFNMSNLRLAIGGTIVEMLRAEVYQCTGNRILVEFINVLSLVAFALSLSIWWKFVGLKRTFALNASCRKRWIANK